VLLRFLAYGALGWCFEVVFTGLGSALRRDRSATAKTYLWMHPIYGLAGLLLERTHDLLSAAPWYARGLGYLVVIYLVEAASGWGLRKVLGACRGTTGARGGASPGWCGSTTRRPGIWQASCSSRCARRCWSCRGRRSPGSSDSPTSPSIRDPKRAGCLPIRAH
jgi:hypothetical protein